MDPKDMHIEELEIAIADRNYELLRLQARIDRALELLEGHLSPQRDKDCNYLDLKVIREALAGGMDG